MRHIRDFSLLDRFTEVRSPVEIKHQDSQTKNVSGRVARICDLKMELPDGIVLGYFARVMAGSAGRALPFYRNVSIMFLGPVIRARTYPQEVAS